MDVTGQKSYKLPFTGLIAMARIRPIIMRSSGV